MDPSTKAMARKPILSVETGTIAGSAHTSASTAPINSSRTSFSSTNHGCHIITTSRTHPEQDQPQYTDDHPAVLEFTKAYLEEAFNVTSTKDLLAKQKDEDETDKHFFSRASPIESPKWWKRSKSESKTPTSGQLDEKFNTTALMTALPDLSNPDHGSLSVETITHASTQTFISPECTLDTAKATPSVGNNGGNAISPTLECQMQIPRKDVGSGRSKVLHTEGNPLSIEEGSHAGKDGSCKDKGKNKEINQDPPPTNAEESSRMEQGSASKGKAKKKKSKRSKGKNTQSKTTTESSQLSQDNPGISNNKGEKPDGSATDNAKLEKDNFVAFKVNEIREETGTQMVWFNEGDAPCAHPNHPRVWNSKNLWCGGVHRMPCARCKAHCCVFSELTAQLENEVLTASEKQSAQNALERITLWISAGNEQSTFLSCTECFKTFCPDCLSVCPLCGDLMCHDCNSEEPWTVCELHGEY